MPNTSIRVAVTAEQVTVGGRSRTSEVVTPGPDRPVASTALVVLHGSNQTGATMRTISGATFEQPIAGAAPLVVYPDAYRGLWNDARATMRSPARTGGVDDVAFLAALIDRLRDTAGIRRVVAVGYSGGGQMALRIAHELPGRLDGLALIGTTQPTPEVFLAADRYVPMPVVLIHGTRDPIVPYAGGIASLFGFRPRGPGLSAPDTAAYYARRNGITAAPTTSLLPHRSGSRGTTVHRTRFAQRDTHPVALYTVNGGGHVVPNPVRRGPRILGRSTRDIDAGELVATTLGGR